MWVGLYLVNFGQEGRKLVECDVNSRMLVSGKDFSIPKYLMPDDIDVIQDSRHHMRRRTLFQAVNNVICTCGFAWAWVALHARNASSSGRATFNRHTPFDGSRPGLKFTYGVWADSLCATKPRAQGKTRDRKRKKAEG